MGQVDGIDVCREFYEPLILRNMSTGFHLISVKSLFSVTYLLIKKIILNPSR